MISKLKNFRNLSPAAKASVAILFANLVLKGLSMISGPIFTRIMPVDQYGVVTTFMSWQSLLTTVVTLNLGSGVFNNGMLEYRDDRDVFQFSLAVISCSTAILFLFIYFIFSDFFSALFEMPTSLVVLLAIYFFTVPVYGYWSGRQRYEFKYKALTCTTIGIAVASLAISLIAVLNVSPINSSSAKIFGAEIPSILVGVFFLFYIGKKAKFHVNVEYIRYALRFNIPLLPHYISMYILSSSDRIMITKLVNTSATAIYGIAYTVGMVISILWQSIEASLSPWIYENLEKNEEHSVRLRTFQVLLFFAVTCSFCALFAPEIIAVLAPKEYYLGVYVIPSIAASAYFIAVYSVYMRIELYFKQTKFAMIGTTIAALLNLLLNYIFIQKYGFIAAGYTTLACYVVLSLLHYINVRRRGYYRILNNKGIFVLSAIVVVVSVAITAVYNYPFVRYAAIVILLILAVLKRNQIKTILFGR